METFNEGEEPLEGTTSLMAADEEAYGELDEFSRPPKARPVKPDISALEDAVATITNEDGTEETLFLVDIGERLLIEMMDPTTGWWYYTREVIVTHIYDDTGSFWWWDRKLGQAGSGNYITGPKSGCTLKLIEGMKVDMTKRRRGRPKKVTAITPLPQQDAAQGDQPVKRKRGRPPGSKNRPKP